VEGAAGLSGVQAASGFALADAKTNLPGGWSFVEGPAAHLSLRRRISQEALDFHRGKNGFISINESGVHFALA
jgi:hypothetical protein